MAFSFVCTAHIYRLLVGDALGGLLFGGIIRLAIAHHLTFMINSLAHTIGVQPYSLKNSSRDSTITAILTFGEGYHNFHHWYAADYRNGIKFWHFDPGKWFIKSMSWLRQTWDLKKAPEEAIYKAKLRTKLEKIRLKKKLVLPERVEQLYKQMSDSLAELGRKRVQWKESLQNKGQQIHRDTIVQLRKEYKLAKAQYKSQFKNWNRTLKQVA